MKPRLATQLFSTALKLHLHLSKQGFHFLQALLFVVVVHRIFIFLSRLYDEFSMQQSPLAKKEWNLDSKMDWTAGTKVHFWHFLVK